MAEILGKYNASFSDRVGRSMHSHCFWNVIHLQNYMTYYYSHMSLQR